MNYKNFSFKNNTGNAIRLQGVSVTHPEEFKAEITDESGRPISLSSDSGMIVTDKTDVNLRVYYKGTKSVSYDYQSKTPNVTIDYECPVDSGNTISMTRPVAGTQISNQLKPVSSVYISLANHQESSSSGQLIELKAKTSRRTGEVKWVSSKVNNILSTLPNDADNDGVYTLSYNLDSKSWELSLKAYIPDGSTETHVLLKYVPQDTDYNAISDKYPTGWENTSLKDPFPADGSYYIPESNNSHKMPWRPVAGSHRFSDLFFVLMLSEPVDHSAQGINAGLNYNLIESLRAVHNTRRVKDGTRIELNWIESAQWLDIYYIIEYTPCISQPKPERYLINGTGSPLDLDLESAGKNEQIYTLHVNDSFIDNDNANKIKVTPIYPRAPELSTIASASIRDTFPTLDFKIDPRTRELTVDVQVNGLKSLERTGYNEVWGPEHGQSAAFWSYKSIVSGFFELTVEALEDDISDLNGFAQKKPWTRKVNIMSHETGLGDKMMGDGHTTGSLKLPILNDNTDTYKLCWTFESPGTGESVRRCKEMSIDQAASLPPPPDGCPIGTTHKLSTVSNQLLNYTPDATTPAGEYLYYNTTPGNHSFTIPSNCHEIELLLIGAGSSGMSGYTNGGYGGAGGGAGGQFNWAPIPVDPGETINITIGHGGNPPATGTTNKVTGSNRGGPSVVSCQSGTFTADGAPNVTDRKNGGKGGGVDITGSLSDSDKEVIRKYTASGRDGGRGYFDNRKSMPGHGGTSIIDQDIDWLFKPYNISGATRLLPDVGAFAPGTHRGYGGVGSYSGVSEYNWTNKPGGNGRRPGIYGGGGAGVNVACDCNGGGNGVIVIRSSGSENTYKENISSVIASGEVDSDLTMTMKINDSSYTIPGGDEWRVREVFEAERTYTTRKLKDSISVDWSNWNLIVEKRKERLGNFDFIELNGNDSPNFRTAGSGVELAPAQYIKRRYWRFYPLVAIRSNSMRVSLIDINGNDLVESTPRSNFTSTGYYNDDVMSDPTHSHYHGPQVIRYSDHGLANWAGEYNSNGELWLQIDLGEPKEVKKFIVYGRYNTDWGEQYVTKYTAAFSDDGVNWSSDGWWNVGQQAIHTNGSTSGELIDDIHNATLLSPVPRGGDCITINTSYTII